MNTPRNIRRRGILQQPRLKFQYELSNKLYIFKIKMKSLTLSPEIKTVDAKILAFLAKIKFWHHIYLRSTFSLRSSIVHYEIHRNTMILLKNFTMMKILESAENT